MKDSPSAVSSRQLIIGSLSALLVFASAVAFAWTSTMTSDHFSTSAVDSVRVRQLGSTPALPTDREFFLRVRGKNNLCFDDRGGSKPGHAKFSPAKCDPESSNQLFVYDSKTSQLRCSRKPNLCLDAGKTLQYQTCSSSSVTQRFVYDGLTQMLRCASPSRTSMCLDDGGAMQAGSTSFTVVPCDKNCGNQHFEIKCYDDWKKEQQPKDPFEGCARNRGARQYTWWLGPSVY